MESRPDVTPRLTETDQTRGRLASIAVYLTFGVVCLTLPLTGHRVLWANATTDVYFEYASVILYWSDLALLLFLAAVAIWWWWVRPPAAGRWPPLMLPLAMLPLLALLSAATAGNGLLAVTMAARLFLLWLFFMAIWRFRPAPRWVALGFALSLVFQSLVAIAQSAGQEDLGWQFLGEIELAAAPGKASIIMAGQRIWLRGYGLTPHPNILGGILVALLLVLVTRFLKARGWAKVCWLVVLSLGALALLATFSRAAWLGGLAGGAVLLAAIAGRAAWRRRYGRQLIGSLLLGSGLVAAVMFLQRDLLMSRLAPSASYTESRSLDERKTLAYLSREIIASRPVLGVGAANFALAIEPVAARLANVTAQPVHHVPYLVTAEIGLAGGLVWTYLMLTPLLMGFRRWRENRLSLWALGLTAALAALAITDLFDFYSWGWPQGRLLRWMLLGLWAAALAQPAEPSQSGISSGSSSYQ